MEWRVGVGLLGSRFSFRYRWLLLLLLALPASGENTAKTFWVSPYGSDGSPGTQRAPFRTVERARDAVRSLGRREREKSDIVVMLRGGEYRLTETLVLDKQDSGRNGHEVIYKAAPGEHPVLCGSIRVTNWALHDAGLNIWRAMAVPNNASRQLYVNGTRATRAQTEPNPVAFLPFPVVPPTPHTLPFTIDGGILYETTAMNPAGWRDPETWTNVEDIEAVIVTQWKMMSVPLSSVDPDPLLPGTGIITVEQPAWTNANVFFAGALPGIWSLWQVTRFENAYEFLDEDGEWYLDQTTGWLYYIPLPGEDITTAAVELPILEVLIDGQGSLERPISNIRFEGLTFAFATWLSPSGPDGYVSDQSGFHLVGATHLPNVIGHDQNDARTPGNVKFSFARQITFRGNIFEHLGGVALDFDTGSQSNVIEQNLFEDISSAAIQLGGIAPADHHPSSPEQITRNNVITDNLIRQAGREFVDAAGLYAGFTRNTLIKNNTIVDVPWSGIAMGWGWGLLDPGSFLGLANATTNMWGNFNGVPTPNRDNKIINNRFHSFLNVVWDGGAIYTTGQQGPKMANGLLIEGNVATGKRVSGGGNTFYTDGGSRYVTLRKNVSLNNPIGEFNFGPPPQPGDPLPYDPIPSLLNGEPYGSDIGGCRTYGDINFIGNYWFQSPIPQNIANYNPQLNAIFGFDPYSPQGYFSICPYGSYPTNLTYQGNVNIQTQADVPAKILRDAGVRKRPATIPADRWILPPNP